MSEGVPNFVELLERHHRFPGPYAFKAIGECTQVFIARVVAEVRGELGTEADPPYYIRESAERRYVSVTIEPMVDSPQQVLAIYSRLGQLDGMIKLL